MRAERADYLIIGAGIIGLTLAKQLLEKFPGRRVLLLEKESDVAFHSSGRNSGVLHAGFYYSANSLKARFTREGNAAMKTYCLRNKLPLNECGKVVVACGEHELPALYELERRGKANGVDVKLITAAELAAIEPNARTFRHALHSPTTATVDPALVCASLKETLLKAGAQFLFSEGYARRGARLGEENTVVTAKGRVIEAGRIINAAGLYADKIARDFGYSGNYTIIPFKGIYLKYSGSGMPVKTNVYPVPNLKNPFLGVHYTVTADSHVKIGPTAIPAFWRENYEGLQNFSAGELAEVVSREAQLFLLNSFGFRSLAFEEMRKYYKPFFVGLGRRLVNQMDAPGFDTWTRPGIRAQLLNKTTLELVQDFVIEGDRQTTHILNAVSPAFTGSFPFTKWIIDEYLS
ncbi:MAG TPA: L-2-hydroxyglutarate oxidase [Elusimicrobia bacterium]|nr:MAG: FAD-dependent oxidoreductase [Elusimicrobia bacterium GWD2_63_28]HCC46735.1 L-2-hydroxyglutarate oxidase [Elusimicrobiota bacterium]